MDSKKKARGPQSTGTGTAPQGRPPRPVPTRIASIISPEGGKRLAAILKLVAPYGEATPGDVVEQMLSDTDPSTCASNFLRRMGIRTGKVAATPPTPTLDPLDRDVLALAAALKRLDRQLGQSAYHLDIDPPNWEVLLAGLDAAARELRRVCDAAEARFDGHANPRSVALNDVSTFGTEAAAVLQAATDNLRTQGVDLKLRARDHTCNQRGIISQLAVVCGCLADKLLAVA